MEIGIAYPQTELHGDPFAVHRFGKAVEDLGFGHLLAYDHVLGAVHADRSPPLPGPYSERDPFHDPFVARSNDFSPDPPSQIGMDLVGLGRSAARSIRSK
jgi:hypothetical protein